MSSFGLQDNRQGKYQQISEPAPSIGLSSLRTDGDDTAYYGHHPDPEPGLGVANEYATPRSQSKWPGFLTLFMTILSGTLIIIVVRAYQLKGNMPKGENHAFNTLSTALILVLGLSFFEAFKSLAKVAGPRIAQWPSWDKDEKYFVDKLDSLTAVLHLARKAMFKNWAIWLCIGWIALNILAQAVVAAISLTFETNDGTNWNGTYLRPGNVTAARLNCYDDMFNNVACTKNTPNQKTNQALAHAYGDLALSNQCCPYETDEDVVKSRHDCRYFCRRDRHNQEFQYRFNEFNPDDFNLNVSTKAYPHFTDRTVAASGTCYNYSVGDNHETKDGYHYFDCKDEAGSVRGNITIPIAYIGISSTTYIYRGLNSPQNAPALQCGDRCTIVWAHRSIGTPSEHTDQDAVQLYECNVTVTAVTNADEHVKELPDDMARLAAASIALSGRRSGPDVWNQYQFYPFGSAFEAHHQEPDNVAADMAESAIGSISSMATTNRPINYTSQVPHLGSKLEVHWHYLIALDAAIIGTHVFLYFGALSLTKPIRELHSPDQ